MSVPQLEQVPSFPAFPASHAAHPDCAAFADNPGSHVEQLAAPGALYWSTAHETHVCELASSYNPATQSSQTLRRPSWFVTLPSPHGLHSVLPEPDANVSMPQSEQVPSLPARPASQRTHRDCAALADLPGLHVKQLVAPDSL